LHFARLQLTFQKSLRLTFSTGFLLPNFPEHPYQRTVRVLAFVGRIFLISGCPYQCMFFPCFTLLPIPPQFVNPPFPFLSSSLVPVMLKPGDWFFFNLWHPNLLSEVGSPSLFSPFLFVLKYLFVAASGLPCCSLLSLSHPFFPSTFYFFTLCFFLLCIRNEWFPGFCSLVPCSHG